MIFMIMILVILAFVVMWNFDVHKIINTKAVTQNAGDAAALMAARWQGITLNLIGELNVMHALSLAAGDTVASDAITNIQARLCYAGPMIAFMASQQAAKNNGIYVHDAFTERVRQHADRVRYEYPVAVNDQGDMLFPEPWQGAWQEYAAMLDTVADNGIAVAPDNARLYDDYTDGHPLIDIEFYEAIAGRTWCWFYFNYTDYNSASSDPPATLLQTYRNFPPCWWPALPAIPRRQYINSEIYGLGLQKSTATLSHVLEDMTTGGVEEEIPESFPEANTVWYTYADTSWTAWDAIDVEGPGHFPVVGPVRPQYDYTGADAVVRIDAEITRLTPGKSGSEIRNRIVWTAAAKPFGFLNEVQRPDSLGTVLPAFHDVRLFPVAVSSVPSGGAYNLDWRNHIEYHLIDYMAGGPQALAEDCWYCRLLDHETPGWENTGFRQAGVDWLADPANVATCLRGGGPGSGPGGGTRIAH